MTTTTRVWVVAAAVLCCGCAGDETGVDPDETGGFGPLGALEPTLPDIQRAVFDPGCALGGCHGADSAAGELDLSSAEASYDALIDVTPANELGKLNGWVRVLPGDPDKSFLVRKLEGPAPGEGSPMPSPTQELDPYYLDLIRTWIADGAQP